jgi:riboflavin kinase/FMN adenylyltransferase
MPPELKGGVVAIGNFDGVHRGHQALLEVVRAEAAKRHVAGLVLTFEPHPRSVLRPAEPVFRLTPLPVKARLLKAVGMDGLAVATFDRVFGAMTPEEFIQRVLVRGLGVNGVVVGFNFRFGRARAGDVQTLVAAGAESRFEVKVVSPVVDDGMLLGSSDVRHALAAGNIRRANGLLGYRWLVTGRVAHGEGRGHALGFPTANIRLPKDCALRHGVYAARLQRQRGIVHTGVASYGNRPTFGGGETLLEVHVLDFNQNLYDEEVRVTFVDWIRPEEKFATAPELVAAIGRDVAQARAILAPAGSGSDLDQRLAALD